MPVNDLYLVVLPLVRIGLGPTEQVLTLLPDKNLATEFFPDEVDTYIEGFKWRANKYLTGGHVKGYDFEKENTSEGRFIVRVIQNVE